MAYMKYYLDLSKFMCNGEPHNFMISGQITFMHTCAGKIWGKGVKL